MSSSPNAPEFIVIIGPTAAGKSALAMAMAPRLGGEIISADSRHVYRGMDIGTNKPSPADQRAVLHHLIDLRAPHESFSLSEYVRLARAAMEEITQRGKTPMLVGGTGQYVRALLQGWQVPEVPPNDALREHWLRFAEQHGEDALFAELVKRDPAAGETIDKRNVRRVVRALEVMEMTGQRWSDLQRRQPLPWRVQMHYVNVPRDELYARADSRLMQMIEQGWRDEVRQLLAGFAARGISADDALKLPSMSALGYREIAGVVLGRMSLDDAVVEIKRATRRFIRMQDTWFRKDAAAGEQAGDLP
jgi:tRNA dimethylallyltransferase